MVEVGGRTAASVAAAYDWNGMNPNGRRWRRSGTLLAAILVAKPDLRGAMFDLPECREGAEALSGSSGLADRGEFVGSDFFAGVRGGTSICSRASFTTGMTNTA